MEQKFDKCQFFVMRHGERADKDFHERKKIELSFDPHLTPLGGFQAFEVGNTIKKTLKITDKSPNQPKFLVVSSPFLRCIMTACSLIKNLGSENIFKETLFLDNTLAEHMDPDSYEKCPIPNLHVRTSDPEKLKKYFEYKLQDGLISEGNHVSEPDFPEPDMYPRPNRLKNYEKFLSKIAEIREEAGEDLVVVVVTHWFCVEFILEAHGCTKKSMDVGFAAVSHIIREYGKENKDTILFMNDKSHLKPADLAFNESKKD